MWLSRKRYNELEKRVTDLEKRSQPQKPEKEELKERILRGERIPLITRHQNL